MYPKHPITAIGQILTVTTIFATLAIPCWCETSDKSASPTEDRKLLYHQANQDRLIVQQTTKKFISMSGPYENCISKIATDESCKKSILELRAQLNQILDNHTKIVGPAATPEQNTNINSEVNVTIQNNNFFPLVTPTRVIVPYQPPNEKPRNSFTPMPGFVPKNRYQAGDGFNQ